MEQLKTSKSLWDDGSGVWEGSVAEKQEQDVTAVGKVLNCALTPEAVNRARINEAMYAAPNVLLCETRHSNYFIAWKFKSCLHSRT